MSLSIEIKAGDKETKTSKCDNDGNDDFSSVAGEWSKLIQIMVGTVTAFPITSIKDGRRGSGRKRGAGSSK